MSVRKPRWLPITAALGAVLAPLACGEDPGTVPNAACTGESAPLLPLESGARVRGAVRIRDRRVYAADGAASTTGSVQGSFADFSAYTSTPAQLLLLSDLCVGVTSRQVSNGRLTRLDLTRLSVSGTERGDFDVARTSTGTYVTSGSQPLIGAADLRVVGEAGGFPGFDVQVPALAPLVVNRPASTGPEALDYEPLPVEWDKSDGDWIEILIQPASMQGMAQSGGQALCYVEDDGCFDVPPEVNRFLLASQAATYTLTVERHRFSDKALGEARVEVEATSEWERIIENGVLAP